MSRYRLRFLLQEFDLHGPEVLLGRSGDCQITLEDPLVSRRHARILVDPVPTIHDLGSRNGVKINGRRIEHPRELLDGDRIRLGTQELVFSVVQRKAREARPTGFMKNCLACGTPFPEESSRCPHCGAAQNLLPDSEEQTTMSGVMEPNRSWTFQLLGEIIERAIQTGRREEAERLLRRAANELEAQIRQRAPLDVAQVETISLQALRLARATGQAEWVAWTVRIHRELGSMFSPTVLDQLQDLDVRSSAELSEIVDEFVSFWRRQRSGGAEQAGLLRLERLMR